MPNKPVKNTNVMVRLTEDRKQDWEKYINNSNYYDTLTDLVIKSVSREINRSSSNSSTPDTTEEIQNLENKIDSLSAKLENKIDSGNNIYHIETHYNINQDYTEELEYMWKNITGEKLEKIVADLWENKGYYTKIGQQNADKGADIIAISDNPVFRKEMIQVKNTINKVDSDSIRNYNSAAIAHQADYCIIVTTNEFTKQAISVAEDLNVRLINGNYLCDMLDKYDLIPN